MTTLPATGKLHNAALPAALVALGLASVALLHAWGGEPLAAVALPLLGALVVLVWQAPLRKTLLVACFLMLALECGGDLDGVWHSPLHRLAMLLHSNLNLSLPVKALRFSGFDALCALLGAACLTRALRDQHEGVRPPRALQLAALATLGTVVALIAWGALRGGDLQQVPWQTHQLAFAGLLALLFSAALRGRLDAPLIGRLVVAAALLKAALACWVRWALQNGKEAMPTATSHHDSLLFAVACAVLLTRLWERPARAALRDCLLALPLLFAGMVANNRRLVWVELFGVCAVLFLATPRTRLKRTLSTALVAALPLALLYVAVGWGRPSAIFKPVATLRSVVDSNSDRSSATRDVENYNLLTTLRQNPLVGQGFGHEYLEAVQGDDIKSFFPQYRFIPHNSLLGLWAFGGLFGFFGLLCLATATAYFATRAHRFAHDHRDRVAALVCLCVVLVWTVQCWGDMGVIAWHGAILLGGAAALSGQLAVQTGAWT